jgi:transposase
MAPPSKSEVEAVMVGQERWEQIRQMFFDEKMAIAEIARRLGMDRKTVRRWVRTQWKPYQRAAKEERLLTAHADFLRERAAQVQYSAQILFQELRRLRGYRGSYETVKRFVAPLRELQLAAEVTQTRFETPPGQQSQIDWGQTQVPFRSGRRTVHFFVLTLGYSRRGFYWPSADERLAQFLDGARARIRALRRAHPRTSLRPNSLRVLSGWRRSCGVEPDVQEFLGALELRVATLSALSRSD